MQFAWDKDVRMHVYLGEKPKEEKEKRKEDELVAVRRDIFGRQDLLLMWIWQNKFKRYWT